MLRRQLEIPEFETRRDGASDERPVAARLRRLPSVRRHNGLRALAGGEIVAKSHTLAASVRCDFELQRRAGIKVPDFNRVDAVPMGSLPAREQKINRSRCGTATIDHMRIPEYFAVMPTLRVWFQIKKPDDFCGGEVWRTQVQSPSLSFQIALDDATAAAPRTAS